MPDNMYHSAPQTGAISAQEPFHPCIRQIKVILSHFSNEINSPFVNLFPPTRMFQLSHSNILSHPWSVAHFTAHLPYLLWWELVSPY